MKAALRRIEHLERARPAPVSSASPSEVRQRILASLNDASVPSVVVAQRAPHSYPLSLRQKILEHLNAQQA